jgi:glutamine amidotransferase
MIAIIDYGMGNIHSVNKALESCGAKTQVINKADDIRIADKVVLPGVGAFNDAADELRKQGLDKAINSHINNKKPFLGICLGMQLLFESSQEAAGSEGLGILKGEVKKFKDKNGFKVPHIGWNQLKKAIGHRSQVTSECPLLRNIPDNAYVYFCHSYYPEPQDKNVIAATTDHAIDFTSVIWLDNVYGVQFHPEKSQETGLKILKNFVNL